MKDNSSPVPQPQGRHLCIVPSVHSTLSMHHCCLLRSICYWPQISNIWAKSYYLYWTHAYFFFLSCCLEIQQRTSYVGHALHWTLYFIKTWCDTYRRIRIDYFKCIYYLCVLCVPYICKYKKYTGEYAKIILHVFIIYLLCMYLYAHTCASIWSMQQTMHRLFYMYLLFIYRVCNCVCIHTGQRTACQGCVCSSLMWIQGIKLWLSGLAVSAFIYWAIFLAYTRDFYIGT